MLLSKSPDFTSVILEVICQDMLSLLEPGGLHTTTFWYNAFLQKQMQYARWYASLWPKQSKHLGQGIGELRTLCRKQAREF